MLVAGQALAFWSDYYQLTPPTALQAGVTYDIDFLGTKKDALRHAQNLEARFGDCVVLHAATIDDPPPNSAVIVLRDLNGRDEPIIIDYLTALQGYKYEDEPRLRRYAVPATVHGRALLVMHPFDCLKSRTHNLIELPAKRNEMGIAQVRLSMQVVKAYLREACADGWTAERSRGLPVAEQIILLASSSIGVRLWLDYDIDVLEAIPVNAFCDKFQTIRWPRVVAAAVEKRQRIQARLIPPSE